MDWALIESACSFLLAAVSPLVSTPNLTHIRPRRPHPVRRYQKRERPRNRKSTRNDKRKTRNHPFGCVSNMSGVRESDIEYMAAHPP
ncbi:Uncharacterized protein HZ326_0233 [Fusarium oxysporum f. sp. albedinis]|nr:Uncharacterized protein HZ326_0233 [Fusarium oxysporum f. sp. albedinis]